MPSGSCGRCSAFRPSAERFSHFSITGRATADSPAILERGYRAALNVLGRDPTALPAQLVVGGMGLGGRVAAGLVADRLQADGLFVLGFPLHPQDKPEKSESKGESSSDSKSDSSSNSKDTSKKGGGKKGKKGSSPKAAA